MENYTVERLSDNARIVRKSKNNRPIFVSVGNIIIFKKDNFTIAELGELERENAFKPNKPNEIVIINPLPNFTEQTDDENIYLTRYAQSIAVLAYNQYIKKRERIFNNTSVNNNIENLKYSSSWLNKGEYWLQDEQQWKKFLKYLQDKEKTINLLNDPNYLKIEKAGPDVEFLPYNDLIQMINAYVRDTVEILNPKTT